MTSKKSTSKHYTHWIHCNICYSRYNKKEHRFYLLACYHITCEPCIVELALTHNGPHIYKCPVCQKVTRACEINNAMPKNLKELFHPEPYTDIPNSFHVLMFQVKHRQRFRQYVERQYASLREDIEQFYRAQGEYKKMYLEYGEIKTERKNLEKRVALIRQQRREIDNNRSNKSSSSSSGHSSSSGPQPSPPNIGDIGITSFSNALPKYSFIL